MVTTQELQEEFKLEFLAPLAESKEIFRAKLNEYGTTWKAFRQLSLADQIMIKVKRAITLDNTPIAAVDESIQDSLHGVINYSIIALMGFLPTIIGDKPELHLTVKEAGDYIKQYESIVEKTLELALKKNADYDNAWKDMYISSILDIMKVKVYRLYQLLTKTYPIDMSKPIQDCYFDLINYSVYVILKLQHLPENKIARG